MHPEKAGRVGSGRVGRSTAMMAVVLSSGLAAGARAQEITTLPSWNGTAIFQDWAGTPTYGQTFTPTATDTNLRSITFELSPNNLGQQALNIRPLFINITQLLMLLSGCLFSLLL